MALCVSTAEYCCPVWSRSAHCKDVHVALNDMCRLITGCICPTPTQDLYVLSQELLHQTFDDRLSLKRNDKKTVTNPRHNLYNHMPITHRLKSRHGFINSTTVLNTTPEAARQELWSEKWDQTDSALKQYTAVPKEQLSDSGDLPWKSWRTANQVRCGKVTTPSAKLTWGYTDTDLCKCGHQPCDLTHLTTTCEHYGTRSNTEDIRGKTNTFKTWLGRTADTI